MSDKKLPSPEDNRAALDFIESELTRMGIRSDYIYTNQEIDPKSIDMNEARQIIAMFSGSSDSGQQHKVLVAIQESRSTQQPQAGCLVQTSRKQTIIRRTTKGG